MRMRVTSLRGSLPEAIRYAKGRIASLVLAMTICTATAQDTDLPTVSAVFDRDSVMIGDRFHLDVRVEKDMMQMVEFPAFGEGEQPNGVEVLGEFPSTPSPPTGAGKLSVNDT